MAGPNTRVGGNTGRITPKTDVSRQDQLRQDKQSEILGKLGAANLEDLPSDAQSALRKSLDDGAADLSKLDAGKVAGRLHTVVARQLGREFEPEAQPEGSVKVPSDAKYFSKPNDDGSFKLTGGLAQSPVSELMKELDINPQSYGKGVHGVLDGARGKDLGNPKNWQHFSSKLAEATLKDTPTAKLAATIGIDTNSGVGAAGEISGVDKAADLGLAKTARTADEMTGVRSDKGVDAVMNNESVRDPGAAKTRRAAVNQLTEVLGQAGLTPEQQAEMKPILDKVLKEGQLGAKTESAKSWAIVRAAQKEIGGTKMPEDKGGIPDTKEHAGAAGACAAYHLFNLAAVKSGLGASLDYSKCADAQSVIKGYTKASASKAKSKSGASNGLGGVNLGSRKVETDATTSTTSTRGPGKMPESKKAAHEFAAQLGLDPTDTASAHTVRDIEGAFSQVMNGAKDDKEITMRALKWTERHGGGDSDKATAKYATMIMDGLPPDSPVLAQVKQFALQKVATCAALGPEGYQQYQQQQMQAGNGGGINMGGGGGIPGGPGMMPGGPGMMPGGPGMVPGMGGPAGAFGQFEQQLSSQSRFLQCGLILNDPALSHEDKIMLFLMIMASHQDHDRIRKMQEMADLENKAAVKKQASDNQTMSAAAREQAKMDEANEAKDPTASATATAAAATTKADGKKTAATGGPKTTGAKAEAKPETKAPPSPGPKKTGDAPTTGEPKGKTIGTAEANEAKEAKGGAGVTPSGTQGPGTPGRISPEAIVQAQAQQQDQNEMEGPKSREIIAGELDRINKFRDMLMEMVNSMMRAKNQTMRDMWR